MVYLLMCSAADQHCCCCCAQPSNYDPFALFYNKHWSVEIPGQMLSAISRLLLPNLPSGARILDLCCGTGQVAGELTDQGFKVTGVDGSRKMLDFAQVNAPCADLIQTDARAFRLAPVHDAAICVFDSLNHMLTLAEVAAVFCNVFEALKHNGLFVFDINTERGFLTHWRDYFAIVEPDNVCVMQGEYSAEERLGRYRITLFRLLDETWQRSNLMITERCYEEAEVRIVLEQTGFRDVTVYDAARDLGLTEHVGRAFFACRK